MPTDRPSLFDRVASWLAETRVAYAVIGAAALAARGISRSTLDIDLLVTDRRVLDAGFWTSLPPEVEADIRIGDADDPLAGLVRLCEPGERDVDLVVGRGSWEADIVARAEPSAGRRTWRVARAEDLVLLKLYAGGSQDRWDIEQLLALPSRDELVADVDQRVTRLPASAQQLWLSLRPTTT